MPSIKFAQPCLAIICLLTCGAAPSELPRQFDYACEATLSITAQVIGTRPPPRKVTRRYSVDQDRNLWCWNDDACKQTLASINRITDEAIIFVDKPDQQFTIRRRDGKLSFVVAGLQTTVGTCRLEAYTPIGDPVADGTVP